MVKKKPTNSAEFDLQHKLSSLRNKISAAKEELSGVITEESLFHHGPPVSPKDFIESRDYYGNSVTNEVYPWIIDTLEEVFSAEFHAPKYETVVCLCGIGSGKGTLAALSTAYMWYWLLSFKSLKNYFATKNISWAEDSTISFINMAPRKDQAKDIVFDRVKKIISRVKFFRDRGWLPDPNISSKLIYRTGSGLDAFDKLAIVPGNSSATFTLGYSIFGGVIDECCFFLEKNKDPCKTLYEEMDSRRRSRFKNLGVTMLTSSANTEGNYVFDLIKESASNPSILSIRKSTYDCRPEYFDVPKFEFKTQREKMDGTVEEVTLHPPVELQELYNRNRTKTLRDWDAIPSVAGDPFFSDFTLLLSRVNKERKDPCPDEGMEKPETPYDVQTRLPADFRGSPGVCYRIHIDLAKGNLLKGQCGVGFAMAHKVAHANDFKIKLDLSIRFKAPLDKDISITEILALIQFLKNDRGFNIDRVTFDQWQSQFPVETINSWKCGITADEEKVGYKQYTYLKNLISANKFDMYYDQHLLYELKRIEDFGTTIAPSSGSTMDEADAVAGAVSSCANLTKAQEEKKPRAVRGATVPRTANINQSGHAPGSIYRGGGGPLPGFRR